MVHSARLYALRFNVAAKEQRDRVWQVLRRSYFQRYIKGNGTVPDLGAGHCEFINHTVWRRRIALDLTEEIRASAARGVGVIQKASPDLRKLPIAHWFLGQQSWIVAVKLA